MSPFRSIRWRLQLWYGLLIAALLGGFAFTAYYFERNMRLERIDGELEHLAFEVNHTLRNRPPPLDETAPRRTLKATPTIADVFTSEHAARGFYVATWTRNGVPFAPSANAPADLPKPKDGPPGFRWMGTRREAFLGSNPGDVALAGRDLAPDFELLHGFAWKLASGSLAIFAATILIGSWLVTRALRPIRDISETAQKIATGDLAHRIDTRDTDSELGQLAGVLNSTFTRLEAAFAQQGRFTADAAHELRTPVTVILTHVQNALATENISEEQREALEACQRAAQRMRRLIESLLKLARLDAGQETAAPARLDLAEITRESVEHVGPLAEQRHIAVKADCAAVECRGSAELLGQVITNLVVNAIHHNRDGGEVRVTTHGENGHAVLVVTDNGPGIAAEHLPHIFERFYRADKARAGASGRTGLGLAISHAIVVAHGGAIDAQSRAGEGATFTVRLPRA